MIESNIIAKLQLGKIVMWTQEGEECQATLKTREMLSKHGI